MDKKAIIGWIVCLLIIISGIACFSWYHLADYQKQDVTTHKVKRIRLVAFGDSLTQGVGDTTKQGGYPMRVATLIAKKTDVPTTSINFGKEGDRSDQIMVRLANSKEQQNELKKANAILVTAGGNDLLKVLQKAIIGHSAAYVDSTVTKTVPQYEHNLKKLLQTIRQYNNHAPIFLFGNYNPLYVYFPSFETINKSVTSYNQVNKSLVQEYGGYYVPIFEQLTYGQYQNTHARKGLISEAKLSNVSFLTVLANPQNLNGEKNKFLSPSDHFHPNDQGYNLMANRLVQKMLLNDNWLYDTKK